MLRRNRFGFRLRRRSLSSRLVQMLVVLGVLALFLYFIGYAFSLAGDRTPPDYSWLKSRYRILIRSTVNRVWYWNEDTLLYLQLVHDIFLLVN